MNDLQEDNKTDETIGAFPFAPQVLFLLFFRPSAFFETANLRSRLSYVLAAYLVGITNAMDRLDIRLLQAEYSEAENPAIFLITDSWAYYWGAVLAAGAISGYLTWLVFGWWYGYRARACGFDSEDVFTPRLVYIHSFSVATLPLFLLALTYTGVYESYTHAYFSSDLAPIALLIFPFWSCVTSYIGTKEVLGLEGFKPIMLFLVLPITFYLVLYVFFGILGFYIWE